MTSLAICQYVIPGERRFCGAPMDGVYVTPDGRFVVPHCDEHDPRGWEHEQEVDG